MKTTYDQQAQKFLNKFEITLGKRKGKKPAQWTPAGHHYIVILGHKDRTPVVFDFWGSAHDAAKNNPLTDYSILACLSSDVHCPDTFEDFCAEYGYDSDSRKAYATFQKANAFGYQLRQFFTAEEIEALQEIQ